MDAKPVICLMGPTASGKTSLAIELFKHLPIEIISVDSALIYRGMNIGNAKPTIDVLQQVPHRLIDICDPSQSYSAGEFRKDALLSIESIFKKKRIPLLVGGTMLYFYVLQHGIAELPQANKEIRQRLQQELETNGLYQLHSRLQALDPISAQRIHTNDPQRILRALEVIEITGKTLVEHQQSQLSTPLSYQFSNIALIPEDRILHRQLIENRLYDMFKQGFVEEVEKLFLRGDLNVNLPSMRTVGYRQIWQYLEGKLSNVEMQEKAIIATRQLAKRQMTWLRSWKNLLLFAHDDKNNTNKIIELVNRWVKK